MDNCKTGRIFYSQNCCIGRSNNEVPTKIEFNACEIGSKSSKNIYKIGTN